MIDFGCPLVHHYVMQGRASSALTTITSEARALAAVALVTIAVAVTPTSAVAKCMPVGRGPDNDRVEHVSRVATHGSDAITAVKSHIYAYSPWVYPGGFSYSYVMLDRAAPWTWAQIGHYEAASDDRWVYAQWANGTQGSLDFWRGSPVALGTYRLFTVSKFGGVFNFIEGTITRKQVTMSWTPTTTEISSEVHNIATQMMGESGEHVNFDDNKMRINGGSYQSFDGVLYSYNTSWYSASGNSLSFDTWDDTC